MGNRRRIRYSARVLHARRAIADWPLAGRVHLLRGEQYGGNRITTGADWYPYFGCGWVILCGAR